MNELFIKNLKTIHSASLSINNLTLLTGCNSSGKSTVIQAILLLRQSYTSGSLSNPIKTASINLGDEKSLTRLGNFQDVFHDRAEQSDSIELGFTFNEKSFHFKSVPYNKSEKEDYMVKGIESNIIEGEINPVYTDWENSGVWMLNTFQYLSADRIAPIEYYVNPSQSSSNFLGKRGEYTPFIIENYGNKPIINRNLIHFDTQREDQDTLLWQTNYWLGSISSNIEVSTKATHSNHTQLFFSYRFAGVPQGARKPQNVGYGITPILPIIVALLNSKEKDIIIIENPETHLHPSGQAIIAYMIALAAQSGVQIILETHSDHILNGVLIACKKYEDSGKSKGIDKENVKIYSFKKDDKQKTEISEVKILEHGRIESQPDGFFDQLEKDLEKLMGF